MKATLDIPDDLYRRVRARTALEGRALRSVAVELLQAWLDAPVAVPDPTKLAASDEDAPWLAITRRARRPGQRHDLKSIRGAIAANWAAEAAAGSPASPPGPRR